MDKEKKSRGIQKKLKEVKQETGLSDKEIAMLKAWRNHVITKFSEIDLMLDLAREKLINHEKRIKKLEKP